MTAMETVRDVSTNPLAERSSIDDIIDLYKMDVDRTLLREALKLTPEQRLERLYELVRLAEELREAGKRAGF
jgi:hypothetical protein